MINDAEALHTAARRWCGERAERLHAEYGAVAGEGERPAKRGLLKKLGLTLPGSSRKGTNLVPRFKILDATLVEIERRAGTEFASAAEAKEWLLAASRAAYEEESRPPDLVLRAMEDAFSPDVRDRLRTLGPKAKVIVGQPPRRERELHDRAMLEECEAFASYLSTLESDDLAAIGSLPHRRTLSEQESTELWSLLESRWGIDGHWYPIDREADDSPPPDAVAFQASPFWDEKLVRALQAILSASGLTHVYELREGGLSVDREIDIQLFRPWYDMNEGFWLDDSAEWVIYASHEGSVTIAGSRLLPALKQVWHNWNEYAYSSPDLGVARQIAPNITTVSLHVKPPPGHDPG